MTIAFDNGVSGGKVLFFWSLYATDCTVFLLYPCICAGLYKTIIADMRLLIALPESCASFIIDASVELQQCCYLSSALPHYNYCSKNKTHSAVNSRRVQLSINNNRTDFISQWVRSKQTLFVPNPPT